MINNEDLAILVIAVITGTIIGTLLTLSGASLLTIVAVSGLVGIGLGYSYQSKQSSNEKSQTGDQSPVQELKNEYASGNIKEEEFERRLDELLSEQTSEEEIEKELEYEI